MPSQKARPLLGWLDKVEYDNDDELGGDTCEIREGEEILVGRDPKNCRLLPKDPSISGHHLKFYSVIYNDEPRQVFVYAQDLSTNGSYWHDRIGSRYVETLIGRGNAILLSSGDKIKLCDGTYIVFSVAVIPWVEQTPFEDDVQQTEIDSFSNLYRLTNRQLGAGSYGKVILAVDRFRSRQMACKIVKLSEPGRLSNADFASKLWREVNLLKDISHRNIIHIERVFYTDFNIYIIEDLIAGGDLRSYIDQKDGPLANTDASMIVYQILKALQYLHRLKIAHRDLKPENVLMTFPAVDARIVVADFGQSIKTSTTRMHTFTGTVDYVAPEVHWLNPLVDQTGYTIAADMWSLGVLTTTLFLGRPYFTDTQDTRIRQDSTAAIEEARARCDLDALDHSPLWESVHQLAKDFIKRLLVLHEAKRATVKQAIEDPWFKADDDGKKFEKRYKNIVKGWKATMAAQDFLEHLDVFMDVQRKIADLKAMPPPAKPVTRPTLNKEHASPYFCDSKSKHTASLYAVEKDKRPVSLLNDDKENTITATETVFPSPQRRTIGMDNNIAASCQSGKTPLSNTEVRSKNTEHGNQASLYPVEHEMDPSLPEDAEIPLYLEVGGQQKGFRSAKRFASAVAARKKMKEL